MVFILMSVSYEINAVSQNFGIPVYRLVFQRGMGIYKIRKLFKVLIQLFYRNIKIFL